MADSTLVHEATIPLPLKGHDTFALGPSDSSDTGSDIAAGADPDLGLELASDSDRQGTGERGAVGMDETLPNDTALHVEDTDELVTEAAEDDGILPDVADDGEVLPEATEDDEAPTG